MHDKRKLKEEEESAGSSKVKEGAMTAKHKKRGPRCFFVTSWVNHKKMPRAREEGKI